MKQVRWLMLPALVGSIVGSIVGSMDVLGAQASLISTAPEGAALYFIEPVDGATVQSPFVVKFGLKGMGVAPAGIDIANTGHHHLLVNSPLVDESTPLPTSDQVRHFGGGQTEAEISLPKGTHQLQLVLGNYLHIPHDPAVKSPTITITVR